MYIYIHIYLHIYDTIHAHIHTRSNTNMHTRTLTHACTCTCVKFRIDEKENIGISVKVTEGARSERLEGQPPWRTPLRPRQKTTSCTSPPGWCARRMHQGRMEASAPLIALVHAAVKSLQRLIALSISLVSARDMRVFARICLPSHPCAILPPHTYGISGAQTHTPNPRVLVCVLVGGGGGGGGGVGEPYVCRSSP